MTAEHKKDIKCDILFFIYRMTCKLLILQCFSALERLRHDDEERLLQVKACESGGSVFFSPDSCYLSLFDYAISKLDE